MNARPLLGLVLAFSLPAAFRADVSSPPSLTPDSALRALADGNRRFQRDAMSHPRQDTVRRRETADGQHPFAIVLTCADSRVPPEIVFDQGIGDLFVVRVAGNVAGVLETASIDYGAEHLRAPVCVVMGHSACGAVKAAVDGLKFNDNLANLMVELAPAVERTRRDHPELRGKALLAAAIETNVRMTIETLLRRSETLRARVREGKLQIVGAVYDLGSGRVQWLGPMPGQSEILNAADGAALQD